jgi:hypothetical protein
LSSRNDCWPPTQAGREHGRMTADPEHDALVGALLAEARRLTRGGAEFFDTAVRLAELAWNDWEALFIASDVVLRELDSAPTAETNDLLPIFDAAQQYRLAIEEGLRHQDPESGPFLTPVGPDDLDEDTDVA